LDLLLFNAADQLQLRSRMWPHGVNKVGFTSNSDRKFKAVATFARGLPSRAYFPFTLSVIGTLSIRLRDLTMSLVVSAYFLKCGVSRWVLKASAFV
jgi:hypothetical protein